jgi:hypothetical protein
MQPIGGRSAKIGKPGRKYGQDGRDTHLVPGQERCKYVLNIFNYHSEVEDDTWENWRRYSESKSSYPVKTQWMRSC